MFSVLVIRLISLRLLRVSGMAQRCKVGGLSSMYYGGDGRRRRMICGLLGCDCAEDNSVISPFTSLLNSMPSKVGQQDGSDRLSNMLPRRLPLAAQVRRL